MAFTFSSRHMRISGGILTAECLDSSNNTWSLSSIDLNRYLRNSYGSFLAIENGGFIDSARNVTVSQKGLLSAELDEGGGFWAPAQFDLNFFLGNVLGKLEFRMLPAAEPIDFTNSTAIPSLEGSVLTLYLMGNDGVLHPSRLDLNDHYGNNNGTFRPNDRGFASTARNVKLTVRDKIFTLEAELQSWEDGPYDSATTNLGANIVNSHGRLTFVGSPILRGRFWDDFSQFFEGKAVVGFVVAGIYTLMGNTAAAERAISLSANSTIVMCGIAIGTLLGGPWGAAVGAALMTPIGIFAETTLSPADQTATIERYIYESIRNGAAAGAGIYLTGWLTRVDGETLRSVFAAINEAFGGKISSTVIATIDLVIYDMLKHIIDKLSGGIAPRAWVEVEAMVATLVKENKIQNFSLEKL